MLIGQYFGGTSPNYYNDLGNYKKINSIMPKSLQTIKIIGENIPNYFLYSCSINRITIGEAINSIGNYNFGGAYSTIKEIYCEAKAKPSEWEDDWNDGIPVIWDCNNNDVATDGFIYTMIDGLRYAIKDGVAEVIQKIRDEEIEMINIPSSIIYKNQIYCVSSIGQEAFSGYKALKHVYIPNTISQIKYSAFYGCGKLEYLIVPSSVIEIEQYAFAKCDYATIILPSTVIYIDYLAFNGDDLEIYYEGKHMPDSWDIDWNKGFYDLDFGNIYYYSKQAPNINSDGTAYDGNYWHYVNGVPTIWVYTTE